MVSGIGPAATLKANNIPAISTLEGVGQNLWVNLHVFLHFYWADNVSHRTNATSAYFRK